MSLYYFLQYKGLVIARSGAELPNAALNEAEVDSVERAYQESQENTLKDVIKTSKNRLEEVRRLRAELESARGSFMPKDDTKLHHTDITHDGVWKN